MSHYDLHHSESTITELRAQLAAAEQQLTTRTAMLGECEKYLVAVVIDHPEKCVCYGCALITRIRAATKGKT